MPLIRLTLKDSKIKITKKELSLLTHNNFIPPHWHDNYNEIEFIIGINNHGTYTLNEKKYSIHCGDLFLMTSLDVHSFEWDNTISLYTIAFDEENLIPEYLNILFNTKIKYAHFDNMEYISNLCNNLLLEDEKNDHFSENNKKFILNQIFAEIIRNGNITENTFDNYDNDLIQKIVMYLRIHIREPHTLSSIAKKFNISPGYLSHFFKDNTGISFKKYIEAQRLALAENMLLNSNETITAICYECGFSTVGNFLKRFKAKFGVTPSQFRERQKQK